MTAPDLTLPALVEWLKEVAEEMDEYERINRAPPTDDATADSCRDDAARYRACAEALERLEALEEVDMSKDCQVIPGDPERIRAFFNRQEGR